MQCILEIVLGVEGYFSQVVVWGPLVRVLWTSPHYYDEKPLALRAGMKWAGARGIDVDVVPEE